MTEVAKTFSVSVESPSVPPWFATQPTKSWAAIPGVNTVDAAWAGQSALSGATNTGICDAWNCAVVDQARGEYVFAANGGHGDYRGNEVLAVKVRDANPRWYRLLDHSPNSAVTSVWNGGASSANTTAGQGENPNGFAAMYTDGRMRAVHGWYSAQYHAGRVWYVMQSSVSGGSGNSSAHAWSFDRSYPGLAVAYGQTPLAWTNDAGPWKWLGTSTTGDKGTTSAVTGLDPSAGVDLDPVTGLIWSVWGDQGNWTARFGSLNTATEAIQTVSFSPGYQKPANFGVVCYDPAWNGVDESTCRWRLFVVPSSTTGVLMVLNLKAVNPYQASAWSYKSIATSVKAEGLGGVYHAPSRSILAADPVTNQHGNLLKIRVPTNPDGTYNDSGTWDVSTITSTGANPGAGQSVGIGGGRTYGKLRMIKDMGNGQSALVLCAGVTLPTYVYKLPTTEIS